MTLLDGILRENGVNAYFCGHVHELEHVCRNGFDYFISGGGGSNLASISNCPKSDNFAFNTNGFAQVLLYRDRMDVTFWSINGDAIAEVTVKR